MLRSIHPGFPAFGGHPGLFLFDRSAVAGTEITVNGYKKAKTKICEICAICGFNFATFVFVVVKFIVLFFDRITGLPGFCFSFLVLCVLCVRAESPDSSGW